MTYHTIISPRAPAAQFRSKRCKMKVMTKNTVMTWARKAEITAGRMTVESRMAMIMQIMVLKAERTVTIVEELMVAESEATKSRRKSGRKQRLIRPL